MLNYYATQIYSINQSSGFSALFRFPQPHLVVWQELIQYSIHEVTTSKVQTSILIHLVEVVKLLCLSPLFTSGLLCWYCLMKSSHLMDLLSGP